jgi:hypothetical protein
LDEAHPERKHTARRVGLIRSAQLQGIAAGSAMIKLGDRSAVETALAAEQSPDVSEGLKQLLLRS